MTYNQRNAKVDGNHNLIKAALQAFGCYVANTKDKKNFCDLIAIEKGNVFFIEVKASSKSKQSGGEVRFQQDVQKAGANYAVIVTVYEALLLVLQLKENQVQSNKYLVYDFIESAIEKAESTVEKINIRGEARREKLLKKKERTQLLAELEEIKGNLL
jgi:Holliday junction resolvase